MITLFTNHWDHKNQERQSEIDYCINRNIDNQHIDRVVIIGQSSARARLNIRQDQDVELIRYLAKFKIDSKRLGKILWEDFDCTRNTYNRPTFENFFYLVNKYCSSPADISIITNSDIYFDSTIRILSQIDFTDTCIALSRHEADTGRLLVGSNSQDSWIFQGKIRPISNIGFPMGINGCDVHLNWRLANAGYRLVNPCFSIKSLHVHNNPYVADRGNNELMVLEHKYVDHCSIDNYKSQKFESGIIAFSLFGDHKKYCYGAIKNAELAKFIYPGWVVRFYVDDTVPEHIITTLGNLDVEIITKPRSIGLDGMFWRLAVADDLGYRRWIIRDADSRLSYRERAAVDDWMLSGLPFHTMHDHPYHVTPIMPGMFGGISGYFNMGAAISSWTRTGKYGDDEHFLTNIVWPNIKNKILMHNSTNNHWDSIARPFPTSREFGRFVGEIFDEHEHCHLQNRDIILQTPELR